mgnify:CR=1 FL=1
MNKKIKLLYAITIICAVVFIISSSYILISPNATHTVIKATDYPVTPDENMTVVKYNELNEEFQEDFIKSYTENKYEPSEINNTEIIEYDGDFYKLFYKDNVLTNSGIFVGIIVFFSFMLLLILGVKVSLYKEQYYE